MNKKVLVTLSAAAVLALTACGGSESPPAAITLGGTAAVGSPIVGGTVNVACAAGSAINPATTTSSGSWQVTISGQTLPCAIQVSSGTVNGIAQSSPYHSLAITFGIVNITPLTDLIIANMSAQAPGTWFSGLTSTSLQAINQTALNAAAGRVNSALGVSAALAGSNPLTTAFNPVKGNLLDDILEALAKGGATHANLLTLAQSSTFAAPSGFNFQTAYATVQAANGGITGGGSTSGGTTGGGTSTSLTVGVAINGIDASSIQVGNVPAPGNQTEFCGGIESDSTFSQIGDSGGGTLTINSCSFANNVGTVNATLSITSPVAMTLPYKVTYTYQ